MGATVQSTVEAREPELVFQQAVEGLFVVGLRGRVTPTLTAKLRPAGLDLGRPLLPAYPRAQWNEFLRISAETLYPAESKEGAYRALGRQLLTGYAETLVGKAIAAVIRLIGPRRTLDRMTRNFRSGGNYNLSRVDDLGPGHVFFWLNEPTLPPSYVAGILEAALELAGARGLTIEVHSLDAEGCTYRIRWQT